MIALDEESAGIVRDMGGRSWGGGHFLVFESVVPDDALLRRAGSGGTALLSEELEGADAVVMIASALRPNAMVLVVLQDLADVPEVLSALRV